MGCDATRKRKSESLLEAIGEGAEPPDVRSGREEPGATASAGTVTQAPLPETGPVEAELEPAAEVTSPEKEPAADGSASARRPVPSQEVASAAPDSQTDTAADDATEEASGNEAEKPPAGANTTPGGRDAGSGAAGAAGRSTTT